MALHTRPPSPSQDLVPPSGHSQWDHSSCCCVVGGFAGAWLLSGGSLTPSVGSGAPKSTGHISRYQAQMPFQVTTLPGKESKRLSRAPVPLCSSPCFLLPPGGNPQDNTDLRVSPGWGSPTCQRRARPSPRITEWKAHPFSKKGR